MKNSKDRITFYELIMALRKGLDDTRLEDTVKRLTQENKDKEKPHAQNQAIRDILNYYKKERGNQK